MRGGDENGGSETEMDKEIRRGSGAEKKGATGGGTIDETTPLEE